MDAIAGEEDESLARRGLIHSLEESFTMRHASISSSPSDFDSLSVLSPVSLWRGWGIWMRRGRGEVCSGILASVNCTCTGKSSPRRADLEEVSE